MIRVLIVDDSAVLRQSTRLILQSDAELQVVGEASNGLEAIALADKLRPDVITMDLNMPKMDGFAAIREIMAEHPAPIVVVTGADLEHETRLAAQAAKLGAISVLQRPAGMGHAGYQGFATKLIEQVKLMSAVKVIRRSKEIGTHSASVAPHLPRPVTTQCHSERSEESVLQRRDSHLPWRAVPGSSPRPLLRMTPEHLTRPTEIIAIGSSTGGPAALHRILSALPANFVTPVLVVQHISFGFVEGLASWLDAACSLKVKVGCQGERIEPGHVYIAPDGSHLQTDRFGKMLLSQTDPVTGFRPSITPLFESVARNSGPAAIGVILTGMGADGAVGMQALRAAGAITVAQDEASCVVFGMPKEAIALGAVQHIVPLDQIARVVTEMCTRELKT